MTDLPSIDCGREARPIASASIEAARIRVARTPPHETTRSICRTAFALLAEVAVPSRLLTNHSLFPLSFSPAKERGRR